MYELFVDQELNMVVGRALKCCPAAVPLSCPKWLSLSSRPVSSPKWRKCRAAAFRDGNVVDLFKAGDWEWARRFVSPQDPGP